MSKNAYKKVLAYLFCLLFAIFLTAGYLWYDFFLNGPKIKGVTFDLNGQQIILDNNSVIEVSIEDTITIRKLVSNIPFNFGLKINSSTNNNELLVGTSYKIYEFLENENLYKPTSFGLHITFKNQLLYSVKIVSLPYIEDYISRANMILDKKRKLEFLKMALESTNYSTRLVKVLVDELIHVRDEELFYKAVKMIDLSKINDVASIKKLIEEGFQGKEYDPIYGMLLARALELDPTNLTLKGNLCRFYVQRQDLAKAYGCTSRLGLYIGGITDSLLKELAELYLRDGDLIKAQEALGGVREEYQDPSYFSILSRLRFAQGRIEDSLDALERICGLLPDDLENRFLLLELAVETKSYERARRIATQLLARLVENPTMPLRILSFIEKIPDKGLLSQAYIKFYQATREPVFIYNSAVIQFETGRLAEAEAQLEEYLKINNSDETAMRLLIEVCNKLNKPGKVARWATQLLNVRPNDPYLYLLLCESYCKMGDCAKGAEKALVGIRKNLENKPLFRCALAGFLQSNNLDKAQEVLKGFIEAFPEETASLLELARLRELQGDIEGALAAYGQYLEEFPQDQEAQEAFIRLRMMLLRTQ